MDSPGFCMSAESFFLSCYLHSIGPGSEYSNVTHAAYCCFSVGIFVSLQAETAVRALSNPHAPDQARTLQRRLKIR